jgi:hypothetical protein
MKPFSNVGILLVRATHTSSNAHVLESFNPAGSSSPATGNRRLAGIVTALLGIAVAGVLTTPVHADQPVTVPHDAATVARARAAFLKHMSAHRPLVRSNVPALPSAGGSTSLPSVNWSGYVDAEAGSKRISSVSGEWVIPNVQCPTPPYQYSDVFIAQWVGIDGATNDTVEQLGTATECFEGVPYYYVWYEMYPAGSVEEGTAACINNNEDCPEPGDRVSASVIVTSAGANNVYTLALTDYSHPAESFSIMASCGASTCLDASAEWIVERPALGLPFGAQITPLADFFDTGFANGELTSAGNTTYIEGFKDGAVYDAQLADDTESYWLDCVGQTFGPRLLLTTNPNSCPVVSPIHGTFVMSWDSSF